MTATKKKLGRPKGSGAGLEEQIAVRLPPEKVAELDAHAAARDIDRSALVREILTSWLKRQGKPKEKK